MFLYFDILTLSPILTLGTSLLLGLLYSWFYISVFNFNCSATHVYLKKISLTHIKKKIPLLNLLFNSMLIRSAPQILSIKDEYTFRFLQFLIIGLCNSSANSLFEIFSFPKPLSQVIFNQKFVKNWSTSMLISMIFRIFSIIKSFIKQYFIKSCFSGQSFKISISHVMLNTRFI